jgi:uncharacterized protein (DUF433 family)
MTVEAHMATKIEIVDRGRGPQLSTSRITVQDVVPYLQDNWSYAQIREAMPILTDEEIQVIEQYIRDHYEEVMAQDRRIRERAANRVIPPEILEIRRKGRAKLMAMLEKRARNGTAEKNGDHPSG